MAPAVRLACEACGARYLAPITVTSAPCPDNQDHVHVSVEADSDLIRGFIAAHRAPYVESHT